jgi:hypothetical protein
MFCTERESGAATANHGKEQGANTVLSAWALDAWAATGGAPPLQAFPPGWKVHPGPRFEFFPGLQSPGAAPATQALKMEKTYAG